MIDVSDEYREAIVSQCRRVKLRALVDITSPNFTFGSVTGSAQSSFSRPDQIHDKVNVLDMPNLTLEPNRWVFGKEYTTDSTLEQEWGYETSSLFGSDGTGSMWVRESFEGMEVLQAVSIFFSENVNDGYPVNFKVEVFTGEDEYEVVAWDTTITGNDKRTICISDFSVDYPTAIKLTVTKWSLPYRRMRIPEIWPGVIEEWSDDAFVSFDIQRKASLTNLSIPYTTCSIEMDNSTRRFDPLNKAGMFRSLEERQGIEFYISVNDLAPVRIGKYYQKSKGWATGNSSLTMHWELVDIVGLLADRSLDLEELDDEDLPTTLNAWVALIMSQLGAGFVALYDIQDEYKTKTLTTTKEKLGDVKCGDLLCYLCQATHTWPRAKPDGALYIGDLENQNNLSGEITLDNLDSYPSVSANDDVARIDIKYGDSDYTYSAIGTSSSSQNTISVANPFIATAQQAQELASYILQFYGGNIVETSGRGDPSREIGDLVSVDLFKNVSVTGRILEDTVEITDKVLSNCRTKLLNIDQGVTDYNTVEEFDEDTTFTIPDDIYVDEHGKCVLHIILIGAGKTGGHGSWVYNHPSIWDEDWDKDLPGDYGETGRGGKIFFTTLTVDPISSFSVVIGKAAEPLGLYGSTQGDTSAQAGTPTRFGIYTSENGTSYESGYIDPVTQKTYGRAGQPVPVANSGDGGAPGVGIIPEDPDDEWSYYQDPTKGIKAADGHVVVYYKVVE